MASRIDQHTNGHHQSSREVHQEINRIRSDMDHTLEEIGDYLHPKHVLDYVVDSIRSGSPGATKQTVREYANHGVDVIKRHPGPAMLLGGAVLWYLMDQNREDHELDYRGPMDRRRGMPRSATYGAWEEGYDWASSSEDEQTWSGKAMSALEQVRSVVADQTMAAKEKVKHVARHMVGASGKSREQLHSQWASLREHAGSYVDARTGAPYDQSYGDTAWSQAQVCACLSDDTADDSSWSGKAQDVVNSMAESLKNTSASVKDQFRSLGGHLASLVSSGGSRLGDTMTSGADKASYIMSAGRERVGDMAARSARGMSRGWDSASSGLHSAADSARHGMTHLGEGVASGVRHSGQQLRRAASEQPLAVGAACLGLGLLAGLLAPATRRENEFMGDASDRLKDQVKDQAREVGQEAMQRGKEVASTAVAAVKDEADRQGITPDKLAESMKTGSDSASAQPATGASSPQKSGQQPKAQQSSGPAGHGLGTAATANPGSTVSRKPNSGEDR